MNIYVYDFEGENEHIADEHIAIEFPSIFDAKPESALFFLNLGFNESAKRVIRNFMARNKEEIEFLTKSNEIAREKVGQMAIEIDILEDQKTELEMQVRELEKANERLANTNDALFEEHQVLFWRTRRMEKTIRGLNKGYGSLKRAFNSHKKKINQQIGEMESLSRENELLKAENRVLGTENVEIHNKNAKRIVEEIELLLNPRW